MILTEAATHLHYLLEGVSRSKPIASSKLNNRPSPTYLRREVQIIASLIHVNDTLVQGGWGDGGCSLLLISSISYCHGQGACYNDQLQIQIKAFTCAHNTITNTTPSPSLTPQHINIICKSLKQCRLKSYYRL